MSYEYKREAEAQTLLHRHETGSAKTEFQLKDGTWDEAPNMGRYWRHGLFFYQTLLDERGEPLKRCNVSAMTDPPMPCVAALGHAGCHTFQATGSTDTFFPLRRQDIEDALYAALKLAQFVKGKCACCQTWTVHVVGGDDQFYHEEDCPVLAALRLAESGKEKI